MVLLMWSFFLNMKCSSPPCMRFGIADVVTNVVILLNMKRSSPPCMIFCLIVGHGISGCAAVTEKL